MSEFPIRLDIAHRAGCGALSQVHQGHWQSPWILDRDRPVALRDCLGRYHRHGATYWLRLRCNDTECNAVALVRLGEIENAAQSVTRLLKPGQVMSAAKAFFAVRRAASAAKETP
jgi:hypothetical protein